MRELDSQQNRKIVRVDLDGKTYTIKNSKRHNANKLQYKLAEKLYSSIRENDSDISTIAKNTNLKADNIKKCKDHIFYDEHLLDRFSDLGEAPEIKPWQRLETGVNTDQDIEWLKHECAERHHELKYDSGYSEAHERAQSSMGRRLGE